MAITDNKNKTILYADYSKRNIHAAKFAIESLGFGNFVSCDGHERTIELVREFCPDMVMVGLYLDGMQGISTIRAIRKTATDDDPHGRTVPVLLGAPRLDRRAMRDAVEAGIEGVFRQPIDPQRLCKIIETVMKSPRRFVLKDNHFGPARPEDLAHAGVTLSDKAFPTTASETENPGRRKRDPIKATADEVPPAPVPVQRGGTPFKKTAASASSSSPVPPKSEPIETADSPIAEKSPIVGDADNLESTDLKARLNGAGHIFDDSDLPATPHLRDKHAQTDNIKAVQSVRNLVSPPPKPPAENPAELGAAETAREDDSDKLVEIDLHDALIGHKLWVDTGGKEGSVMSIEHADLRDAELEGIDLSRCGLPFACFKRANCKNAVLRRCNLTGADFIESNLDNANLAASRLSGARFNDAMLRNTVFLGSDLSNASFRGQRLLNCDLSGTNLAGTDFRDADLTGTRGLFAEQIQRARVNANTHLPRNLKLRD